MTLDFHYQSANIVKYRTDVTFGWLDLMVSFGGIAGLFLGCSILSGVEICYYLAIVIIMICKETQKRFSKFLEHQSNQAKSDASHQKFRKKAETVRVIKVQPLSEIDSVVKVKNHTRY